MQINKRTKIDYKKYLNKINKEFQLDKNPITYIKVTKEDTGKDKSDFLNKSFLSKENVVFLGLFKNKENEVTSFFFHVACSILRTVNDDDWKNSDYFQIRNRCLTDGVNLAHIFFNINLSEKSQKWVKNKFNF